MPNVMAALPTSRVPCSNAAKTRNPLKLARVPKTPEHISAVSGPKVTILRECVDEILLFNKFFSTVNMCLSCEDTGRQSCAMMHRWRICGDFCVLHIQTCILNSHYRVTPCGEVW